MLRYWIAPETLTTPTLDEPRVISCQAVHFTHSAADCRNVSSRTTILIWTDSLAACLPAKVIYSLDCLNAVPCSACTLKWRPLGNPGIDTIWDANSSAYRGEHRRSIASTSQRWIPWCWDWLPWSFACHDYFLTAFQPTISMGGGLLKTLLPFCFRRSLVIILVILDSPNVRVKGQKWHVAFWIAPWRFLILLQSSEWRALVAFWIARWSVLIPLGRSRYRIHYSIANST